jgi:hypothetical protein
LEETFVKVTLYPLAAVLAASLFGSSQADAQVRVRGGVRVVTPRTSVAIAIGRPYYYRPSFYRPYYRPIYRAYYFDPFFYGPYYRPFYWYPYAAGYAQFDGGSAVRVQVMPRDTEVYIDNYYAGTVDDFDGFFQRLHIEPGPHDVTLYRDGYRTARQRIYVQSSGTFRLRYNMVPLGPGEIAEPRPVEPQTAPPSGPPLPPTAPGTPPQGAYPPPRGAYPPPPPRAPQGPEPGAALQGGTSLSIRVQPSDAEVFIDGERWEGPANDDRLVVQVAPGPHHIEVRREGYRTYATDVTARGGEASMLNISLSRQR